MAGRNNCNISLKRAEVLEAIEDLERQAIKLLDLCKKYTDSQNDFYQRQVYHEQIVSLAENLVGRFAFMQRYLGFKTKRVRDYYYGTTKGLSIRELKKICNEAIYFCDNVKAKIFF